MNARPGAPRSVRSQLNRLTNGQASETQFALHQELPALAQNARTRGLQPTIFVEVESPTIRELNTARWLSFTVLSNGRDLHRDIPEVVRQCSGDVTLLGPRPSDTLSYFKLGIGRGSVPRLHHPARVLDERLGRHLSLSKISDAAARMAVFSGLLEYAHALDINVAFVHWNTEAADFFGYKEMAHGMNGTRLALGKHFDSARDTILFAESSEPADPVESVSRYLDEHPSVAPVMFMASQAQVAGLPAERGLYALELSTGAGLFGIGLAFGVIGAFALPYVKPIYALAVCAYALSGVGRTVREMSASKQRLGHYAVSAGTELEISDSRTQALLTGTWSRWVVGPVKRLVRRNQMTELGHPGYLAPFERKSDSEV